MPFDRREEANLGWKQIAIRWLFTQGTSTVLLFGILGAMIYGIPGAVTKFDTIHDRIEDRNTKQIEKYVDEHRKEREALREYRKAEIERVTSAFEKQTQTIEAAAAKQISALDRATSTLEKSSESVNSLVNEIRKDRGVK